MKTVALIAAGGLLAVWLMAQALAPSPKPAMDLMAPGALLYLEARDFNGLLKGYNASPEKKAWVASQNYQVFLRSHLMTRLTEARKAYLEAAGLPEEAPLLDAVAGSEAAIALYNIGKLEFLYTAKLPGGQFAASSLAQARSKFETRKAGDFNYFIRTKGDSSIAYGLANDRLFLATREDLIASALQLASGKGSPSLSKDRWFTEALAKSPAPTGDIRMMTDMAAITRTPQFRSYWIQRNVSDLRQFATVVSNVTISPASIKEDRILIRAEPKDSLQPSEASIARMLQYAPADAGFYQAIAKPAPGIVMSLLKDRLFAASIESDLQASKLAPGAAGSTYTDGEDDFETRIDRIAPTSDSSFDRFAPLNAIAANTDAILHSGVARLESDQVLVGLPGTVVLHGTAPWQLAAVKRDLGRISNSLWNTQTWTDRGANASELAGVSPLSISINNDILILSTSPQWMARSLSTPSQTTPQPASYTALFRHSQELALFERLTRLVDYPSIPQGADPREPLFFSENIASLAKSLGRLDTISITEHDTGAAVQQTAIYKLK